VSLTPGTHLGPYEILEPLGAGGMGEVYKARDSRLGRDVAIKILPDTFAADEERLARFEQEARAAAALNHPNIAVVFDVGHEGTTRYLVQEYLAGQSLRDVVSARRATPIRDWLTMAAGIADALAAAHRAGIVHRDIKPENVIVTDDGRAKVLDFGLAKLTEAGAGALSSNSPTVLGTVAGVVMGTVGYMSPEQAAGQPVDRRTDIFAVGCIVYEMLTGRRPFEGRSTAEIIAHVLHDEPVPLRDLRPDVPDPVEHLVAKCLTKDVTRRYQHADDLAVDLRNAAETADAGTAARMPPIAPARRWPWLLLAAGALIAGVAGGSFMGAALGTADAPFTIVNLTVPEASRTIPSISPDGRWVAVVADGKIFVRAMDQPSWRELAGTSGAGLPLIFSPNSRHIAFPSGSAIRRVDLNGSPPLTICEQCITPNALRGGSWNSADVLLLGGTLEDARLSDGLFQISANGGVLTAVTTRDPARGENSHRFPAFLPDGRRFVFAVRRNNGEHEIRLGDLDGTPTRRLLSGFSKVAYASGHLLFVRDETLLAVRFDPASGDVSGDPMTVAEQVFHYVGTGNAGFAAADNGTLVLSPAVESRGFRLFDRAGRKLEDVTTRSADAIGRLSPDGRRAAVAELDAEKASTDIYIVDLDTGARTRFTSDPDWEQFPVWSPDQRRIAYRLAGGVFVREIGGGQAQRIASFESGTNGFVQDWSPDGAYLLLTRWTVTGGDLARLSLADHSIESLGPASRGDYDQARLSPDGQWAAYVSPETGANEVHVRSFPDGRLTHRVTSNGGHAPLWSRDGRELFYLDSEGWVMACAVRRTGTAIEFGPPARLFKQSANLTMLYFSHDVDAAGRFLSYRAGDGSSDNTLTVLFNWPKAIQ